MVGQSSLLFVYHHDLVFNTQEQNTHVVYDGNYKAYFKIQRQVIKRYKSSFDHLIKYVLNSYYVEFEAGNLSKLLE